MQLGVTEKRRFSTISHGSRRFWNPLPETELVRVLQELPLQHGVHVLDYGCGRGEVSLELVRRFDAHITGVDPNADALAQCSAKMPGRFLNEEFSAERFAGMAFDLIVNIGASPGMSLLLEQVLPLLRRTGRLLVGDLYWRRRPSDELLAFLGGAGESPPSLEELDASLTSSGLLIERRLLATEADWDQYEDEYDRNMVAYLKEHPADPSFEPFEKQRSAWRAKYLQHARGVIGFALYQARWAS